MCVVLFEYDAFFLIKSQQRGKKMALSHHEILSLLKTAFPDSEMDLTDYQGDSDHYALEIYSPQFAGLSRVQQHQLVYQALGSKMGQELHALTIKTLSMPKELS